MPAVTVTLPDDLSDWVDARTNNRAAAAEFVCALVERERVRQANIAAMQEKIDKALASGISKYSMDEIWEEACRQNAARHGT